MRLLSRRDHGGLLTTARHAAAGLGAMAFFIALGLAFVLLFRPFYLFEMDHLNIVGMSGFSREEILTNYDALIRWCMPWVRSSFSLPTFSFSSGAAYHFEQVKTVFRIVFILGAAGGLALMPCCARTRADRSTASHSRPDDADCAVSPRNSRRRFQSRFCSFHEVVFRNDYWI